MAEVVRSSFNVCGEHVKVTNKREHTKRVHQMTITEYKSKFNQYYYDLCSRADSSWLWDLWRIPSFG